MAEKVFVNSDNTATLQCPKCRKTRMVDVSRYIRTDTSNRLKVRCPCKYQFVVSLEKRKNFRKETCLDGIYRIPESGPGESETQGRIQVLDISKTGLRLKLFSRPRFQPGDLITVEFRLDDGKNTLIERDVYVRNIKKDEIGVEFASIPSLDSALGFYMLN
ncbi:MAG: PilZ domain-containing protein [Desulfosalsimonadaceae bacterium]